MTEPVWHRPIGGTPGWQWLLRLAGAIFLLFAFLQASTIATGDIIWNNTADAWFGLFLCWVSML
jgi:hypothetical protein